MSKNTKHITFLISVVTTFFTIGNSEAKSENTSYSFEGSSYNSSKGYYYKADFLENDKKEKQTVNSDKTVNNKLKRLPQVKPEKKVFAGKKYDPYTEILGFTNNNSRNLGLLDFFIPLKQSSNSLFFLDLRGQGDNSPSTEYNIGLGYRKLTKKDYIIGSYIYYDHRILESDNEFDALTFGVERLGKIYDFRLNLYIPEDGEEFIEDSNNVSINGSKVQVSYQSEKPLTGTDFEVGRRLPLGNTRLFLGGHYFAQAKEDDRVYSELWATTARLETKVFSDLLALGTTFSYDQDSDLNASAYARLRIPFGRNYNKLSYMERRMTDTVIRDLDIVSNSHTTIEGISINNNSVGNVVRTDVDKLQQAINDSSENDLIIVEGEVNFDSTITLKAGQTIISGDGSITTSYNTPFGSKDIILSLGGSKAVINFKSDDIDAITLQGDNITISGLTFASKVNNGVFVDNSSDITVNIEDLVFEGGVKTNGIYFEGSQNNTINIDNFIANGIGGNAKDSSNGIMYDANSHNNIVNIGNFVTGDIDNNGIMNYKSQNNTVNIDNFVVGDVSGSLVVLDEAQNNNNNIGNLTADSFGVGITVFSSAENTVNITNYTTSSTGYAEVAINNASSDNNITISNRNAPDGKNFNLIDYSNGANTVTVEGVNYP